MWTKQQQLVIDSDKGNLLVSAAAGSGKTAVLVERIIQLIKTKKVDIDRLLVVTFTNAAASEMKERIADRISKELDENPDNLHLQNQLILLNRASITTIHSFCLEVIKSNFHKINLNPNFRVCDTTEYNLLKQEAIDEVFENLYLNKDDDFLNLVRSYAEKNGDTKIQEIILSVYEFSTSFPEPKKWIYDSMKLFDIDDDFDFKNSIWAEVILKNITLEIEGIKEDMEKSLSLIENIEELETYKEKFVNDFNIVKKIFNNLNSFDEIFSILEKVEFEDYRKGVKRIPKDAPNFIKENKDIADKSRKSAKESIEKIKESFFSRNSEEIKKEIKYLYKIVKAISNTVIEFFKCYQEKKSQKGIIDFSDIEHYALEILIENDNPSDIALGYKEKFYEIFIDEYQDSNFVQEVLLSAIAKTDIPNRFMVGDVKQSIYRFRQAKPEIFLEKYNNYDDDYDSLNKKIMLYKNFRSREEVIDCVNYIFEKIMSETIGEIDYNEKEKLNLGASFKEDDIERVSEIHLLETNTDEEDLEEELTNIQFEARMVGKIIRDLVDNKTKVYDKKIDDFKDIDYKDIVILMRSTTSGDIFVEELMNMDIPTHIESKDGYFDTLEIQLIMNLLRVIDNPMQDIPILSVLKSSIFSFTEEELIDIRLEDKEKSIYECLKSLSQKETELGIKCLNFIDKISLYKEKSLYMNTDELLWYLYNDTGYYAYVSALPGGTQRIANLKILFERAKQFEENSFKGIFNFINYINRLKKSNMDMSNAKTLGENANVVRIMTIHKSKGLEFPFVICACMGRKFNTSDFKNDILYHHKLGYGPQLVDYKRKISYPSIIKEVIKRQITIENLSEEMRVLYVAFTRAKEKLIITGNISNVHKKLEYWNNDLDKITFNKILKSSSFLDWIMMSVIRHNDLKEFINDYDIYNDTVYDKSKWKAKVWNKSNLSFDKKVENIKSNIFDDVSLEQKGKYFDEISKKLEYIYPHKDLINKPASISVSEIKKDEENYENMFEEKVSLKRPMFIENKKLTSTEKGLAMHLVMQIIDTNNINTIQDINNQLEHFVEKGILTSTQKDVINPYKIIKFFKSDLGKRMLNSSFVKKEQTIYSRIKVSDVYDEVKTDDTIMLRGIVDVYFEEDDEIVIIDYKTDYVTEENKLEIINKYKKQVELYKEAITNLIGKNVKETYLYLFGIDEAISI